MCGYPHKKNFNLCENPHKPIVPIGILIHLIQALKSKKSYLATVLAPTAFPLMPAFPAANE